MPNRETWLEARQTMAKYRNASIRTKDGRVVEGSIFDEVSRFDDPEGIGYVSLLNQYGYVEDVYADEFSELIKAW